MKTEKKSTEIREEAIKISKEKQKILKQSSVPITAVVKAEIMKVALAEARKSTKNIPMVEGKIEVTADEFAIVEDAIATAV
jgi:hypothetical protein